MMSIKAFRMEHGRNSVSVLLIAVVGAAMCGCTAGNERINLGGPSPDAQIEFESFAGSRVPAPVSPATPSLSGLSRAHWAPIEVTTMPDGLVSKPHYASKIDFRDSSARARGEFPSAVSSLDVTRQAPWAKASEGLRAPVRGAWDLGRMLAWDLWTTPPMREVYTSASPYERTPVQMNARPTAAQAPAGHE